MKLSPFRQQFGREWVRHARCMRQQMTQRNCILGFRENGLLGNGIKASDDIRMSVFGENTGDRLVKRR